MPTWNDLETLGELVGQRCLGLASLVLLSSACVTVPPGHAAMVTDTGGVQGPLGEGVHVVSPFATSEVIDLRQQEQDEALTATTADGAELRAGTSLITYRLIPEELPALVRAFGPDVYAVAIRPVVSDHTRRVLGQLRLDQLDTEHLRAAQTEITRGAADELRGYHVLLEGVDLRGVVPTSALVRQGFESLSVLEQRAAEIPSLLRLASDRAEQRRGDALGIAAANAALSPTLDARALAEQRDRAFQALLASPHTTVIIGGGQTLQELAP